MPTVENKTVNLIFKRQEIYDDVNAYAFVEGDIMDENNRESVRQTQDIIQDGNRELCSRVTKLAFSHIKEVLYPFTKVELEGATTSLNDNMDEPATYSLSLNVPGNFSRSTAEYLENLIHQLLVYRILENWLYITKPEAAEKWALKAQMMEEALLSAKSIRLTKVRRRLSPF